MRVAYLITWPGGRSTGVFKKVVDQVTAWGTQGVSVGLFVATTPPSLSDWRAVPAIRHVETFSGAIQSFSVQPRLVQAIRAWGADITYVRTTPRHYFAWRGIHDVKHAIEIQTNDLEESKVVSPGHHALTLATRGRCLGSAAGLVFVSKELARLPSYRRFSSTRTVIGNGIDLERVDELPTSRNSSPRLVFMGMPGPRWHGIDDFLLLAKNRPEWSFDLIGPTGSDFQLPENVQAHGTMPYEFYRPILQQADVAVSSLAWYRNHMNEASPLKSREYLALGLPVIGGYQDTDIPEGSEVYLRVANHQGGIVDDLGRVDAFVDSWQGKRVARDQIAYLDVRTKEAMRLAFLERLL